MGFVESDSLKVIIVSVKLHFALTDLPALLRDVGVLTTATGLMGIAEPMFHQINTNFPLTFAADLVTSSKYCQISGYCLLLLSIVESLSGPARRKFSYRLTDD